MSNTTFIPRKVTAIITAYNSAYYIERCIKSILNQKNESCDVIVIDDGSTDNTEEVIKPYLDRIIYLRQPTNRGPAVGRTIGMKNAKTEFISFLDADDYWHENFAGELKNFLLQHTEVVAITSGYVQKNYKGIDIVGPTLDATDNQHYKNGNVCPNFFEFIAKYRPALNGTMMKTEIALKTGGQREDLRLTQDLEYFCYLGTFGKWAFTPSNLYITDEQILKPAERLKKFKRRFSFFRNMDVKIWTKRIIPALKDQRSIDAFNEYLKYIISLIAVSKIYTLAVKDSYSFVKKYREQITPEGWGKAIHLGLKSGSVFWPVFCVLFKFREILKAYLYPLINKF
jgi:glycosyltransferase involved in cell wall biosynthesis